MNQEIKPEDLIGMEKDGSRNINQDAVESYGLFNLPKSLMRTILRIYYDNAARLGSKDIEKIRIFCNLSLSIDRFPKKVIINFTRGVAYKRNMRMLRRYSK